MLVFAILLFVYEELTTTFLVLFTSQSDTNKDNTAVLERFTKLLYDCTSSLMSNWWS